MSNLPPRPPSPPEPGEYRDGDRGGAGMKRRSLSPHARPLRRPHAPSRWDEPPDRPVLNDRYGGRGRRASSPQAGAGGGSQNGSRTGTPAQKSPREPVFKSLDGLTT